MARKENAAAPQLKNAGRVCEIRVASVLHPPHQDTEGEVTVRTRATSDRSKVPPRPARVKPKSSARKGRLYPCKCWRGFAGARCADLCIGKKKAWRPRFSVGTPRQSWAAHAQHQQKNPPPDHSLPPQRCARRGRHAINDRAGVG